MEMPKEKCCYAVDGGLPSIEQSPYNKWYSFLNLVEDLCVNGGKGILGIKTFYSFNLHVICTT